jgi:dephospho-CoA kinase
MNLKKESAQQRIAVTGGIACGKSIVGSFIQQQDIPVLESDDIAHNLLRKGNALYSRIISVFGNQILGTNQEINRTKLGEIVFASEYKLQKLNELMHPVINEQIEKWIALKEHHKFVCVIIPLLYEKRWESRWDYIICVSAEMPLRLKRLAAKGLSEAEAMQRIDSQYDIKIKANKADYVIVNNGGKKLVEQQVVKVISNIKSES